MEELQQAELQQGREEVKLLEAPPLQEINFSLVDDALAPSCDDQEAIPDIFTALVDKPY